MIAITSYLHRNDLKDLIRRWMYGDARPTDADAIVRLVHFNNAYISRYLPVLAESIFTILHPAPLFTRKARRKGDLKDVIVTDVPSGNPRVGKIIDEYRSMPDRYFRETPFHGTLYFAGLPESSRYIGSSRIKRVRRLAEKSARRIIDRIFASIRSNADRLAQERARRLGLQIEALVTPREDMIEEFLSAESRLLEDLRLQRPIQNVEGMVIEDVAGLKVIVNDADQEDFVSRIAQIPSCRILEVEPHRGRYNAINLIVAHAPDRERLLARKLGDRLTRLLQARGMDGRTANRRFREFVLSGEARVHVEIIVCSYSEMLESEIGRSMHEDRILRQRLDQQYTGQLSRNIEFLMEYLFAFPASTRTELGEIPIRLWKRYLPDYFDEVMKSLFDVPSVEVLD
jgi:hypothetical protein